MTPTTFSITGAIVSGLLAAGIFAVFARIATLNVMNFVRYLGTVRRADENRALGWVLHFALGALFGLIYAGLWFLGPITSDFYLFCFLGGIVHWLATGILVGGAHLVHAGIRSDVLPAPGLYLSNIMGRWGFAAGLVGHVLFGFAFAFFYQFFIYYRS